MIKLNSIIIIITIIFIILILIKQLKNNNDNNIDINNNDNNNKNKLPSMVLMTINLGYGSYLGYKHFDLTLYSMQYNLDVDFILIHVIDDDTMNSNINFQGI